MSNFTYSESLYHSGIKGMKWGIRRFQNEDGTLTEAGKARYGRLNAKVDRIYERKTRDLRKIVESPDIYKHKYNRDRAQLEIDMETKLRDVRKAEIKEGFDYLENRMFKKSLGGWLIGGLPLTALFAGDDIYRYSEQYDNRSEIKKEFKEGEKELKRKNIEEHEKLEKQKVATDQKEFYKDRLYGKGTEIEKLANEGNSKKGFSKEQKEHYQSLAENEGRYNIDFLEAVQGSEMFYKNDTQAMNKEYKKFLEDPEKYWTVDSMKLKQA